MASVKIIAKSKLYQLGLKRWLGVQPNLEIRDKYVRIYYPPASLAKAQEAYRKLLEKEPGEIRIDIKPVIQPYYVKKLIPLLIGSVAAGFIFGKA